MPMRISVFRGDGASQIVTINDNKIDDSDLMKLLCARFALEHPRCSLRRISSTVVSSADGKNTINETLCQLSCAGVLYAVFLTNETKNG